jgi:hypothetical protein
VGVRFGGFGSGLGAVLVGVSKEILGLEGALG